MVPTLRHVLVIGVDGVRFDLLCDDRDRNGVDGHGITANDLTGHRLADHPDFVTVATRAGVSTLVAVSGWASLALATIRGISRAGTASVPGTSGR